MLPKNGVALAALATLLAAHTARAEEFQWRGRVASGRTIEIKGVNGAIDAAAASGDEVEVQAVKRARRSDPASVEIKVLEHASGVTICAVYPAGSGRRPNECAPGSGGHMSVDGNDVAVDFSVRVPKGVRFVGRTVNGGIEAEGLDADLEAHTVNGAVKVSTRGHARAETVNGSIAAALGRADWTGPLDFKTVNGGITVELPGGAGAEVRAQTVNGVIETDFPLTATGKLTRRRLSGTIGSGGRELRLETVNGSIHLRQAR